MQVNVFRGLVQLSVPIGWLRTCLLTLVAIYELSSMAAALVCFFKEQTANRCRGFAPHMADNERRETKGVYNKWHCNKDDHLIRGLTYCVAQKLRFSKTIFNLQAGRCMSAFIINQSFTPSYQTKSFVLSTTMSITISSTPSRHSDT